MSERSDECWQGRHDDCDGCNLDNLGGCLCPCHFDDEDTEDPE